MKIEQRKWTAAAGWVALAAGASAKLSQLVLVFGSTEVLQLRHLTDSVRADYPAAHIFGCSTAGEICDTRVSDDSLVVTAVHLEHSFFRVAQVDLAETESSFQAGEWLGQNLPFSIHSEAGVDQKLVHVLVLSDGLKVNGSDFVAGLTGQLPPNVSVTGGLAGDSARFGETLVFRDGVPRTNTIAVLGLYGDRLKVGYGSLGGWDPFGPARRITKSSANILYELDGQSALGLYKRYLGDHAQELPASGLMFPLSIRTRAGEPAVVRTILSVDEASQSMTFAGDVPEGAHARLMKANFDRLIDGATGAARISCEALVSGNAQLALLISCVGRKLVLRQRVEEEVEAVREVLGSKAVFAGFYSYGEISPFTPGARCELHNQTMTITTLSEQ